MNTAADLTHTHRQSVDGVDQGSVGRQGAGVVANVNEGLKEVGWKQFLEDFPISLHTEQISAEKQDTN